MSRRKGFTLVELLVVIGIIALLISILLPTLGAARRAANTVACLSNVRQLGMATMLFAHEHKGYVPIASDDFWAKLNDPLRQKWAYRSSPSGPVVYDWASSLIPYLGGKVGQTFITAPEAQSKVFRCPADQWMEVGNPGYQIFNNVTGGYQAISYGYNADIACVSDLSGVGRFRPTGDSIGVTWGPTGPGYPSTPVPIGQPLQCKLGKVTKPAEVLLFADCGTRPQITAPPPVTALDYNDALYYTTNWAGAALPAEDLGKLSAVFKTPYLKERIPMQRHGGSKVGGTYSNSKINVAFADGHGSTVLQGSFKDVRVSPYQPR
jgi:prepilin-type N-terminal cleavage/methylation domain-containing protein/prepilin-type processing-associated H-X9-DG protein